MTTVSTGQATSQASTEVDQRQQFQAELPSISALKEWLALNLVPRLSLSHLPLLSKSVAKSYATQVSTTYSWHFNVIIHASLFCLLN